MRPLGEHLRTAREAFLPYTRQAFSMLPDMEDPHILDIGCGQGSQTLELTRLCDGRIIGIDVDYASLHTLRSRIAEMNVWHRVRILRCTFPESPFPDAKFDVLWEEGVLHILDLSSCLRECSRLLQPGGFLVMSETLLWFEKSQGLFHRYDFDLAAEFALPAGIWWKVYYEPLARRIAEFDRGRLSPEDLEVLDRIEEEIAMVQANPQDFDCAFTMMQKRM